MGLLRRGHCCLLSFGTNLYCDPRMRHPRWGILLLALSAALGAGCVRRTLAVRSDPPGALVYLNGVEVGRTPVQRDFVWYGTYDVQVRKDGYDTIKAHS